MSITESTNARKKNKVLLGPNALSDMNMETPETEDNSHGRRNYKSRTFLNKLLKICLEPKIDDIVSFTPDDKHSFKIHDLKRFKKDILAEYYTAKWDSFRRQLYFYGFKGRKEVYWTHANLDNTNPETMKSLPRVKKTKKRNYEQMYNSLMMANPYLLQMLANPYINANPMLSPYSPTSNVSSNHSPGTILQHGFQPGLNLAPPSLMMPMTHLAPGSPGIFLPTQNTGMGIPDGLGPLLPPSKKMKVESSSMPILHTNVQHDTTHDSILQQNELLKNFLYKSNIKAEMPNATDQNE